MTGTGFFITGTDTGCGKTEITLGLMQLLQDQGYQVLGFKPVAAGAEDGGEGLRNEDALRIQDAGSLAVPYELINPYCFAPPIAPHLAAREVAAVIRPETLGNCYQALAELADVVVVEGAGGWRVPLGPELDIADLPGLLRIPAVLVVGLRLGCLNHTLLSADAIMDKGCGFAGWIANHLDPDMLRAEANLATLDERIPAPRLGLVPRLPGRPDAARVAAGLDAPAVARALPRR
jgi:dethiobiotin synthetase